MGYHITKELIIEAWSMYRPSSSGFNTPKHSHGSPQSRRSKGSNRSGEGSANAKQIFDEAFINKLLSGIKLKTYDEKKKAKEELEKKAHPHLYLNEQQKGIPHKLKE